MNLKEQSEPLNETKDPKIYLRIQEILGEQSYSLVLPKVFAINLGLKKCDYVKVRQIANEIIVEKS